MVPSGPPTPVGGSQNIPPSLLRTNSGILGAQGASASSQQPAFPSLLSPRSQYNNMNLLGNISNVSALLNQSFANGGSNSGISGSGNFQRGGIDIGAESDPLSGVASSMGFMPSSTALMQSSMKDAGSSGQTSGQHFPNPSGNQIVSDQQQQQSQQLEAHNFQHGQQSLQQLPLQQQQQQQQQQHRQQQHQQQHYPSLCGGLNNLGSVKFEPQMTNDQNGPPQQQQQQQQQQLQSLRNMASVKLEPQQLESLRSLGSVKLEPQHSEQSLFLHQQQQQHQQQLLQMSRQNSQPTAAHINLLQHQRLLQLQKQQQQQQILKSLPQQRAQLQQRLQQSLPVGPASKPVLYEPGTCARRLTQYMYHQQHRPPDNNIEFWRKFVREFFALSARKRWCVSLYGSGRQTTGVFPQDVWHCEICNRKPGRGFETTVEVIPRLCKIKYDSGTLEELLYVDMPREYQNALGQIVLDYGKAVQESVFEHLRVVREGQLRIIFSPDLKICSWEFCARRHEELIPRRVIVPQVSQLGAVSQKYQSATQSTSSNLSTQELESSCNMFVASARQLAKALEVPLVNDLGYTKRYVRCLQISEVVNSMKDLIDYSQETGNGPMESLINFPRRTATSSIQQHSPGQQPEGHQITHNSNKDQSSVQAPVQLAASNAATSVNHSLNSTTSTSASTVAVLHRQNSMNSRQDSSINNANSPYGGNAVQIPSAGSSTSNPQSQPNQSSLFPSPTLSASNNNPPQAPHSSMSSPAATHLNSANSPANISMQKPSQSMEADRNDSQSSVQQIIQEMMMTSQLNGGGKIVGVGSLGNEMKNVNGITHTGNAALTSGNCLIANGMGHTSAMNGVGYGNMSAIGPSGAASGVRSMMPNAAVTLNGRVGIPPMTQDPTMHQQQDLGNRLLSGLGAVNSFNSIQFDWKASP